MPVFCKIVITFLGRNTTNNKFLAILQTKKLTNSYGTIVEVHHYELGAIDFYFKGAAISVSTIRW